MSERLRTDSAGAAPSLFGDGETRFERDPTLRPSPEVIGEAVPHRIDPQVQRDLGVPLGRAAVAAQQRSQREQRVQALAPKIGKTAVEAQRRDEIKQTVTRQLGYKAVERARLQDQK